MMEKAYYSVTNQSEKQEFSLPGRLFRALAVFLFKQVDLDSTSVEQCRKLMVSSLPLCSLPRFVECDGSLWIRTLYRFRCGSEAFFSDEEFCQNLVEIVFATVQLDVKVNMIRLLIAEGDTSSFMNVTIWQKINTLLSAIDISDYYDIPENHYHIFNTPEGVLFNTAVIDENSEENVNAKNLRRDNKAYSYKEQQAEIQLRKELAEKKRAEGKLTKQQEKAIENELKRESNNMHRRSYEMLVSKYAVECLPAFRDAAFDPSEDYLHEIVDHATLRELKSSYLFPEWCEESLEDQIGRTFALLSTLCLDLGCDDEEEELDVNYYRDIMNVSKLLFVLPLLKSVVYSTKWPSSMKFLVVNFIKDAVRKSFIKKDDIGTVPLVEYAQLLLSLIGNHEFSHIFDACNESLGNMADIIEMSDEPTAGVPFYQTLIQYLPDALSDEKRIVALKTLSKLRCTMTSLLKRHQCPDFVHRIFVARFDSTVEVKGLAEQICTDLNVEVNVELCEKLLDDVKFEKINLTAVPEALKAFITVYPNEMNTALIKLKTVYEETKKPSGGEVDQLGRLIIVPKDQSSTRLGYASCFLALAQFVRREEALHFISLIVPDGLCDADSECRAAIIHAASRAINRFGEVNMNDFLPYLEKECDALSEDAEHDVLREGLVVLLGTFAKDLDEGNPKMTQIFARLIATLSTPSQQALADGNEYVRDSALKAGQRLIQTYVSQAKKLLLPELQSALFDDNWRIRHASVTLTGDFLFNISGVSGKITTDTAGDDGTMGMESASKVIARTLGSQMRDNILSGLYLARSDIATVVRQAASHVWKVVVTNTPRTVKEIMKPPFERLLSSLSSKSEDRQLMAARCLEGLVRNMNERLINDVLPVLSVALGSDEDETRIGVSACLCEIISDVPRETVQFYAKQLIPLFAATLTDPNETVRKSAARTFNSFHHSVGPSSLDVVIGPLFKLYVTEKSNDVLDSLCILMTLNGRHILPFLLPKLTKGAVDISALCKLAGAGAQSITHHITTVLDALIDNFENIGEEDLTRTIPLMKAIEDEEDVLILVCYLVEQADRHVTASKLLKFFLENAELDAEPLVEVIVPNMFSIYKSLEPALVDAAIATQMEIGKRLNGTNIEHVVIVHGAIKDLCGARTNSPISGFGTVNGLKTVLPILREGILTGAVDAKELAADAMGDVVKFSSESALRPHVIATTGPLIR
ncbi:hypothetical protein QR680_002880 [Steinernema hermaphroditum]|uniref:Stalled ribosome sensor GCN1-like HEAT repeats region domain-containing protein n=1 Tax=Steinernema hermaphroditum TaxID=289476 RepID=A0AA39LIZ1_9BILA|nr:hypothetical protein QR680_002880 [Steinernema hermaphroditum]